MIEFKTEEEEIFEETDNGAKTVIVYEPADEKEIKIENEFFLPVADEQQNIQSKVFEKQQQMSMTHGKCRCSDCDKNFDSYNQLSYHEYEYSQKPVKEFKCTFGNCNYTSRTQFGLFNHNIRHSGEKPHICNVCTKSFRTVKGLKLHSRTHTGRKRFSCKICHLSCSLKSLVIEHEKFHSASAVYFCAHCGKTCFEKRSIQSHLTRCYKEYGFQDQI